MQIFQTTVNSTKEMLFRNANPEDRNAKDDRQRVKVTSNGR